MPALDRRDDDVARAVPDSILNLAVWRARSLRWRKEEGCDAHTLVRLLAAIDAMQELVK
jgi:hypothetical protein